MVVAGHVENGVVVLDGGAVLREGARVVVSELERPENRRQRQKMPAELPLVSGGLAGSIVLTNQGIAEILDEDDVAVMKRTWDVPS